MPPTLRRENLLGADPCRQPTSLGGLLRDGFRWTVRSRDEGEVAVDDTVGEVSGTWMTGRPRRRSLASCSTSWSKASLGHWRLGGFRSHRHVHRPTRWDYGDDPICLGLS
jgi:hypothetical protein